MTPRRLADSSPITDKPRHRVLPGEAKPGATCLYLAERPDNIAPRRGGGSGNFEDAEILKIESLNLPEIFRFHVASPFRSMSPSWSLDAARTMRDYAAHLGAGLPKYLVMPEAGLVLSYIDDLTAQMYFETLWNTGARFNEALALTPACFTLEP